MVTGFRQYKTQATTCSTVGYMRITLVAINSICAIFTYIHIYTLCPLTISPRPCIAPIALHSAISRRYQAYSTVRVVSCQCRLPSPQETARGDTYCTQLVHLFDLFIVGIAIFSKVALNKLEWQGRTEWQNKGESMHSHSTLQQHALYFSLTQNQLPVYIINHTQPFSILRLYVHWNHRSSMGYGE